MRLPYLWSVYIVYPCSLIVGFWRLFWLLLFSADDGGRTDITAHIWIHRYHPQKGQDITRLKTILVLCAEVKKMKSLTASYPWLSHRMLFFFIYSYSVSSRFSIQLLIEYASDTIANESLDNLHTFVNDNTNDSNSDRFSLLFKPTNCSTITMYSMNEWSKSITGVICNCTVAVLEGGWRHWSFAIKYIMPLNWNFYYSIAAMSQ